MFYKNFGSGRKGFISAGVTRRDDVEIESAIVLDLGEASREGTGFIETPVDGRADAGGFGIPKHHPVRMVAATKGNTGEGLRLEIGALLCAGSFEVTDGTELEKETVIGFATVKKFKRRGDKFCDTPRCVGGSGYSDRLHVDAKGGFAGGPEPKTLWKIGLEKEGPSCDHDLFPRGFDKSIFRLLVGRRGAKLDAFVEAKVGDGPPQELGVEIGLYQMRDTTDVDKKLLKLVDDGGALEIQQPIDPLLTGGGVDEHEAVFLAADGDAAAISDIHTDFVEEIRRTRNDVAAFAPRLRRGRVETSEK